MFKFTSIFLFILSLSFNAHAFDLKLRSVRLKVSRPETLHSLLYKDSNVGFEKIVFDLDPLNNERLGFFLDLNGFLIGYSADPFSSSQETKTTDIILSLEKFKNSKLSFNYQVLKGFNVEASDAHSDLKDSLFIEGTKSTKLEALGLHNLYTFKGQSLFNHFFLNKPQKSNSYKLSLSLVGSWSVKRLKLENKNNLLYNPSFFTNPPLVFNKINAFSVSTTAGPFVSINLKRNFNFFAETKLGIGYFKNLNDNQNLKESGTEFVYSYGSGLSWTSESEKTLISMKGWFQKGRHIETFFGDLSLIYFF